MRPAGAGAQLLLLTLLTQSGTTLENLNAIKPACPTGADVAQAVRTGRADCGIATRSVAMAAGTGFVPLTWERFDLAIRHRDYFTPGPQALFRFLATPAFRERAEEFGGYDAGEAGQVRHLN
jgi:putative molybdopterin biosynthesis protein